MPPRLTVHVTLLLALSGCGASQGTIAIDPTPSPIVPPSPSTDTEAPTKAAVVCDRVLENFATTELGAFPNGWNTRSADDKPIAIETKAYAVEKDGNRNVLHATYQGRPITIALPIKDWDLDLYPIMQWSWRAVVLPTGADEREASTNDSAASAYVVWDVGLPFMVRSIRYAWSTTLPVGTTVSRRLGYDRVIVINQGPSSDQTWQTVQVNVAKHYTELFKRDLVPPDGIAILTDADSTSTEAEAFYADFRLCRLVP